MQRRKESQMKKQKPMVTIPVKHTCVPLHDYISLVQNCRNAKDIEIQLMGMVGKRNETIDSLKKKNVELTKQIDELNEALHSAKNNSNYWYDRWDKLKKEHEDLRTKYKKLLSSMISDAVGTEDTVDAKTEAD
jgi:predicted nuclease with TOPRIM domain